MQASRARSECDQKMFELGRKNAILIEKYQEDFDVMKEEMEGKINRLREVYTIKITFYLLSLFLAAVKKCLLCARGVSILQCFFL